MPAEAGLSGPPKTLADAATRSADGTHPGGRLPDLLRLPRGRAAEGFRSRRYAHRNQAMKSPWSPAVRRTRPNFRTASPISAPSSRSTSWP
jgi:hypothetical protein